MGDHPLRPPSHRSLGGPLPHQPANGTHAHPFPPELYPSAHAGGRGHGVLIRLSAGYPPGMGRLHTRYAPVRRSPPSIATCAAPRLACVRPAASVHPEPGSNSPLYRRSFDAVFFSRPGLFALSFLKNILGDFRLLYACFPVLFLLGTIASKNARTPRPPVLFTPGLRRRRVLPIPVLLSHPIPSDRERKGSNFFLPSNSFAKKNFLFFQPLQPPQNVATPSKRVQI